MDLNEAVKKLREQTGESQQSFATRLGLSIRAIVNYERDRTPSPKALAAMAHLAFKHREIELANRFWSALPEEFATVPVIQLPPGLDVDDASIMVQMLPRPDSPLPEGGKEVLVSDPRPILKRYARDLNSLISGDEPVVSGVPAAKIRQVAEGLNRVVKLLGQKVRQYPAKVEFKDFKSAQARHNEWAPRTKAAKATGPAGDPHQG